MAVLVVLAIAVLVAGAAGQNSGDCSSAYSSLAPCITYVTGTDATPSVLCCAAVTVLNVNNPACLCQGVALLNNGTTPNVNATKAYALPGACGTTANCPALATPPGVSTPPLFAFPPPPGDAASPPPPGGAVSPPPPPAGNAAAVTRPSPLLAPLAAVGVAVFFSEFIWIGGAFKADF